MQQQLKKSGYAGITPAKNRSNLFLLMNVALLFLLPGISIYIEVFFDHAGLNWQLIGKWVMFWTVGIRLFTAGVQQASNPQFTAIKIFHIRSAESFVLVRELGFANMAIGSMGILSVINDHWRLIAAITGGLYLGLAGMQHCFRKPASRNEAIALFYDLTVFLILVLYIFFS